MTHYSMALVLPAGVRPDDRRAVEDAVADLLYRYDEERTCDPFPHYVEDVEQPDGYNEWRSMAACYGTTDPHALAAHMPDWRDAEGFVDDAGRLYWLDTSNPLGRLDYYVIRPAKGFPKVGWVRDFPPDAQCYALVTPDGRWRSRNFDGRTQRHWTIWREEEDHDAWLARFRAALAEHPDHALALADCHY